MNPLEYLYFLGLSLKKRRSLRYQERLPRTVISVGNLTLGGTGKTPAAIALAQEAVRRGFRPCILTRGYKGKAVDPCLVSRGQGSLLDVDGAGDEAVLIAEKLRGVPVVKGRNRYEAGIFAIGALAPDFSPDLFLLDDGFQHWRLKRDRDILLLDLDRPFGNGRMLPLGPLREPVEAMKRANVIVITGAGGPDGDRRSEADSLIREIRRYCEYTPVFLAERRPSHFMTVKGENRALEWARGRRLFGFCGIGNHSSFESSVTATGAEVAGFMRFRDHYQYRAGDLKSIVRMAERDGADWIVTTEKDIMRLQGFGLPGNLLTLNIDFFSGEGFYEEVFKGMRPRSDV